MQYSDATAENNLPLSSVALDGGNLLGGKVNTYKVIDVATGASSHADALTETEAAIKCGKTAADMDAGRVKVEFIGTGPRWRNFPRITKQHKEVGYAQFD